MPNAWRKAIKQISAAVSSNERQRKPTSDCGGNKTEDPIENLKEAQEVIKGLEERCRAQSEQLLAWRRRAKVQEKLVAKLKQTREEELQSLSAQLVLLGSRLGRKQKDISAVLTQREAVIVRQQRAIQLLQRRLSHSGLDASGLDLPHLDPLNDNDSGVVTDHNVSSDQDVPSMLPRSRSAIDAVTIVRSVSDAVEPANRRLRRSNGFRRRSTVYSAAKDGGDVTPQTTSAGTKTDSHCESSVSTQTPIPHYTEGLENGGPLQGLYGSVERLKATPQSQRHSEVPQQDQVTTYNRVMSEVESKSLEEQGGRLRNCAGKGNKLALSRDQSYV
jgi:hypothetical protein